MIFGCQARHALCGVKASAGMQPRLRSQSSIPTFVLRVCQLCGVAGWARSSPADPFVLLVNHGRA